MFDKSSNGDVSIKICTNLSVDKFSFTCTMSFLYSIRVKRNVLLLRHKFPFITEIKFNAKYLLPVHASPVV